MKVWGAERLYASDLNAEFNNIINNAASLLSPLSAGLDWDGYAQTLDAAGVTTVQSTGATAWSFQPGSKSGTPGTTGSISNWAANTVTDSNTAGSGTAASWTGHAFHRPTLAASNTLVVTTKAATVYIENAPLAGSNETITNPYALWIAAGAVQFDGAFNLVPTGAILEYGGSTNPATGGFLLMNQDVSRTTYATLFAVVGTTYGPGDGSTTFGLHKEGRVSIGAGTGTTVEICTASSGNGFTVTSNNTKWITGMPVIWSALSGFTTSGSAGPTYYVTRISSTNIRFATTLALAQAGTPDVTISGSGSCTVTYTMTARTLGEVGGEESHAQSITELMAHTHNIVCAGDTIGAGGSIMNGYEANPPTSSTADSKGGNAAMNIMPSFVVSNFIIKT